MKRIFIVPVFAGLLFATTGCKNMNKAQKGVLIGAGAGGAVGAVVGKAAGNTAIGAIVGAAVGGVAGGLIGRKMDKQAEEIAQIPGAEVKRVGEGINVTFASGVLFGFDKSDLTAQAQTNIKELATILNKYPDTYVRVEGHTDTTGTYQYNMGLSERRAVAVGNFLKAQGVAANRVQTYWYGATQPVAPNNSDANKAKNRRVEFSIFANDKMKTEAKKESGQQ